MTANTNELKAIPTKYRGNFFRSRTEARWAVFFHELGIEYQYETEGFDLMGTPYLPDFRLPQLDAWFEVKGVFPSNEEIKKIALLSKISENYVLVAIGAPKDQEHQIAVAIPIIADAFLNGKHALPFHSDYFGVRPIQFFFTKLVASENNTEGVGLWNSHLKYPAIAKSSDPTIKINEVAKAYASAGYARFEHEDAA